MLANSPKNKPPVKLKDVARDAGVSVATVSLALRNHTSITEETHKRVIESTLRLGYQRRSRWWLKSRVCFIALSILLSGSRFIQVS